MALFTVLLISVSPRNFKEGFQGEKGDMGDTDIKLVSQKKRWWAEQVLHENPLGIEDDKVRTSAIQDNSNTSNSTNSSK